MAILHQVALRPDDRPGWESLEQACAVGDTVVLLDPAVATACALATVWQSGVRVCIPQSELGDGAALPEAFALIDDAQWWQLIADHELIQHWM